MRNLMKKIGIKLAVVHCLKCTRHCVEYLIYIIFNPHENQQSKFYHYHLLSVAEKLKVKDVK